MSYAELHCLSSFSFQRGASQPEELVDQAAILGYSALAITDECSIAGVVRAYRQTREHPGIKLIIGSEFRLQNGQKFVLLATNRTSYGQLVALITQARRQAQKGAYYLSVADVVTAKLDGCLCLWIPLSASDDGAWIKQKFPSCCWIAVELLGDRDDLGWLQHLQTLSQRLDLPLVSCGDVHMHSVQRQPLQDVLTAIRLGEPVSNCGRALFQNAERHLRPFERLQRIYPLALLRETERIAARCTFSLGKLRYEYPQELVPARHTPTSWLRELTRTGARKRWPQGVPQPISNTLQRELQLIAELHYEPFFLTVNDIVVFARSRGILCQGRGSAANSAVCYALGITEVDPARTNLLFERFISRERNEPPDIDVDFEHERREEVIQYLYRKYGRHRAALAATVISYRLRSAIRDVGKALGLSLDQVDRLAKSLQWWDDEKSLANGLIQLGFDPGSGVIRLLLSLTNQILGMPRHLSQHVGGFVIAQDNLANLVPVENASMANRTVIQWDKDDLETLGLLKVDVLALGMLTAIRKCFGLIAQTGGPRLALADIPGDDKSVWAMIQRADTVGVFQIESRAQMSMLPRLKPTCFYDLVIEIAIVRPGPIQGDMVHPYLERRRNPSLVEYPSPEVEKVLKRTLGVPIFQEQVMQLAVVAAGFTPGEADGLRRSMAAWKKRGGLEKYQDKLLGGMRERGYSDEYAERVFNQIKGFGEYGFPESHSASFALLTWASCWLKHHYPAAFCAAILNSQPMGFYQPAQLVNDAKRHGVNVLPVDIRHSDWNCTLQSGALRLGLRMVKGLSEQGGHQLVACRRNQDAAQLLARAELNKRDREALAAAGALRGLGHRHQAFWDVAGMLPPMPLLTAEHEAEPDQVLLAMPTEGQNVLSDYAHVGLTLERHPVALLRARLDKLKVTTAANLHDKRSGVPARTAGLVINRQRPGTASGVVFVTLEDETGHINLIVWPKTAARQRKALLQSRLLMVSGIVQQEDNVLHLIAGELTDLSDWLGELQVVSRNFH